MDYAVHLDVPAFDHLDDEPFNADDEREPIHQHNRRWWASYVLPVARRLFPASRGTDSRPRKGASSKGRLSPADIARVVEVFRVLDRWYKEQG